MWLFVSSLTLNLDPKPESNKPWVPSQARFGGIMGCGLLLQENLGIQNYGALCGLGEHVITPAIIQRSCLLVDAWCKRSRISELLEGVGCKRIGGNSVAFYIVTGTSKPAWIQPLGP